MTSSARVRGRRPTTCSVAWTRRASGPRTSRYRELIAEAPEELGARLAITLAPPAPFLDERWRFATGLGPSWPHPADDQPNIAWGRAYAQALRPFALEGGYVNFMAGEDQVDVPATYGRNYRRLVEVKRRHDPDNLFRLNQNVDPASVPEATPSR